MVSLSFFYRIVFIYCPIQKENFEMEWIKCGDVFGVRANPQELGNTMMLRKILWNGALICIHVINRTNRPGPIEPPCRLSCKCVCIFLVFFNKKYYSKWMLFILINLTKCDKYTRIQDPFIQFRCRYVNKPFLYIYILFFI